MVDSLTGVVSSMSLFSAGAVDLTCHQWESKHSILPDPSDRLPEDLVANPSCLGRLHLILAADDLRVLGSAVVIAFRVLG